MSDTDGTPDPGYTKQRWTYLGVFPGESTKTVASFRDENGERRSFKAGAWHRHLAVGHIYEIDANETQARVSSAQWTGDRAVDFDGLRLEARGEELRRERKALEAKARTGNSPELDELLTHVETYAAGLISIAGKEALVTLLTKTVWQARRPK